MPIDYRQMSAELSSMLRLEAPPIAISFLEEAPGGMPAFDAPMAEPAPDGRTGRVPAGCVFWMKATDKSFTTVPEDHGNCSVGSLAHGLMSLREAAQKTDVQTLLDSGWVTEDMFPTSPRCQSAQAALLTGP